MQQACRLRGNRGRGAKRDKIDALLGGRVRQAPNADVRDQHRRNSLAAHVHGRAALNSCRSADRRRKASQHFTLCVTQRRGVGGLQRRDGASGDCLQRALRQRVMRPRTRQHADRSEEVREVEIIRTLIEEPSISILVYIGHRRSIQELFGKQICLLRIDACGSVVVTRHSERGGKQVCAHVSPLGLVSPLVLTVVTASGAGKSAVVTLKAAPAPCSDGDRM